MYPLYYKKDDCKKWIYKDFGTSVAVHLNPPPILQFLAVFNAIYFKSKFVKYSW